LAGNGNGEAGYTLWDVYPFADFITYPSLYEGFGNAFLEAIYFKKPILINRYATFVRDIEPLGFDLTVMDGFISKKTVQKIKLIIESSERREQMVNHNYKIAARHYSYSVLCSQLNAALSSLFGNSITQLSGAIEIFKNNTFSNLETHQVEYKHLDN
jgi:glycosyltransferase involved in cell wall biosynthesis